MGFCLKASESRFPAGIFQRSREQAVLITGHETILDILETPENRLLPSLPP